MQCGCLPKKFNYIRKGKLLGDRLPWLGEFLSLNHYAIVQNKGKLAVHSLPWHQYQGVGGASFPSV
jgi:hypothetical protein